MAKVSQVASGRPRVDYYYDEVIGNYVYGPTHPMRPHRVRLTHHLCVSYGLYKHMNIFRPKPALASDMTAFHSDDYISFLSDVTPENMHEYVNNFEYFGIGDDCPIFDGLFEYCQVRVHARPRQHACPPPACMPPSRTSPTPPHAHARALGARRTRGARSVARRG